MADGQSRRPDNIDPGSCLAFSGDSNALQQLLRWFVIWVLGNQFTAKGAGKERLSTCAHAFSCSPGTEHEDEGRARVGELGDLRSWLRGRDLNPRPSGYEPDELPGCSTPRSKEGKYRRFAEVRKRFLTIF